MVKVISCSEGDTKLALGDFPKLFILAEAISDIRYISLLGNPCQGGKALAGINFLLQLLLTVILFSV